MTFSNSRISCSNYRVFVVRSSGKKCNLAKVFLFVASWYDEDFTISFQVALYVLHLLDAMNLHPISRDLCFLPKKKELS